MGGGSIKKLSCGLLPSHLRSQTALRLCASTFGRAQTLQRRQKRPTAPVVFYLSDLLWSDGRDITGKTVLQRRDRLEQIINPEGVGRGSYAGQSPLSEARTRIRWSTSNRGFPYA